MRMKARVANTEIVWASVVTLSHWMEKPRKGPPGQERQTDALYCRHAVLGRRHRVQAHALAAPQDLSSGRQ